MEAKLCLLRAVAVDGGVALRALVAVAEPVGSTGVKQQVLVPENGIYEKN